MKIFILGLAFLQTGLAIDYTVTLKQISKSRKTLFINKGRNDRLKQGEYGILLGKVKTVVEDLDYDDRQASPEKQIRDMQENKGYVSFRPVARVKSIKMLNNSSVWIVHKVYYPESIQAGAKFLLMSESDLLQGRTKLKIRDRDLVSRREKISESLHKSAKGDGERLAKKKDEYKEQKLIKSFEGHKDYNELQKESQAVDLKVWKESNLAGEYIVEGLYSSEGSKKTQEQRRLLRFEKLAANFIEKSNRDRAFELKIKRNEEGEIVNEKYKIKEKKEKKYQRFLREEARINRRNKDFIDEVTARGESWSDDFSDEELKEVVQLIGDQNEVERREYVQENTYMSQVFATVDVNLIQNDSTSDPDNIRRDKVGAEIGFEYLPFKDFEPLQMFSFEVGFRYAQDSMDVGEKNGLVRDLSTSLTFNYYPFYKPNAIEKNIFYLGAIARFGQAKIAINGSDEGGDFTSTSFPGLRAGVKYNFKNNWTMRATLTSERIIFERTTNADSTDDLDNRESLSEMKLAFGIGRFF